MQTEARTFLVPQVFAARRKGEGGQTNIYGESVCSVCV